MTEIWGLVAGHGGDNHGICGNGIIEKAWTLEQARQAHEILKACGIKSVMIRTDDSTLSLADRARVANEAGCTRIISFHVNAGPPEWSKARVLVHQDTSAENAATATAIAYGMPPELRSPTARYIYKADRKNWPDAHAVVGAYRQPVVLIEFGFATNKRDARSLKKQSIRTRANLAIAMGVA